tara:strand:- start:28592 stop:29116 length:525 start_codon:yes stop_codon:yes gene_type:complete
MARRKSSMNKIKLPTFLNKMLKSQLVLYLVLIGALINIIGYFQIQDYTSITLFIIIGLISKCFTKNMIIVLLVPIVIVNVLVASNMFTKVVAYEGLANKKQKPAYKPPPFEGLAGIQQQQKQIMENITTLGPILKDATSLLKKVDMNQMNKVMGKIAENGGSRELAAKLAAKKK